MSVKIRLQRHGKKGKPFYWVVAADARSKRDGKYLEKIGTYNPNTNPATVELNLDSAVKWLHNGAQPTDTARAILSYKGALLKHHLDGGVRKGALTQEQADAKLAAWLDEKASKVDAKKDGLSKAQADAKAKALKAEQEVNAKRLAAAEEAAKAQVNAIYLQVLDQIRTSREQIENKQRQMQVLMSRQATTVRTKELYQEQYKLGTRSLVDLLNAEQAIHGANSELETARYDIYSSIAQYIATTGRSRQAYDLNNIQIQGFEVQP